MLEGHIYKTFDLELKELKEKLLYEGGLVEKAIDNAIKALLERDSDLAKKVIQDDVLINDIEVEIDEFCLKLLALRQPAARDLRFITTAIKINYDLERIGDLAVDVARVTIQLMDKAHITKLEYIPLMADIARKMLDSAIEALRNDDADLARQTTKWDYEIDGMYVMARDKLLKIVIENPKFIDEVNSILLVNRQIERIGDHICNICEAIVYMVEAKREHLN